MGIVDLARALRKNQTPAETRLWKALRNRQFLGKKFLRQHVLVYQGSGRKKYFFIADFYCAEIKLVIELDGKIHDHPVEKMYDLSRDEIIQELGCKVIRFRNEELEDFDSVLMKIKRAFDSP